MLPKKICILLATFNGEQYLNEQIDSILIQQNVACDIYVSDDSSTDSTLEILNYYARQNANIFILPSGRKFGCAALNFYRLLCDVPIDSYDYFAFSDQDDIWSPNKIERAVTNPSLEVLLKLANHLDVEISDFFKID